MEYYVHSWYCRDHQQTNMCVGTWYGTWDLNCFQINKFDCLPPFQVTCCEQNCNWGKPDFYPIRILSSITWVVSYKNLSRMALEIFVERKKLQNTSFIQAQHSFNTLPKTSNELSSMQLTIWIDFSYSQEEWIRHISSVNGTIREYSP